MQKLLRFSTFYYILIPLMIGCSNDESNTQEVEEIPPSALKSTQINTYFGEAVNWFIEFREDGRPLTGPTYTYEYDANNRLIESTETIEGQTFDQSRYYTYENGILQTLSFTSLLSSDGVGLITGEFIYNDKVVEGSFLDGSFIQRYTYMDEDFRYLEQLETYDYNQYYYYTLYEYEYDANSRIIGCKKYEANVDDDILVLKTTYDISYDDKNNPFNVAFNNHDPIVYGLLPFKYDSSSIFFLESHLRRNMPNNVSSIELTSEISGSTFVWSFDYTYNDEDLPLTKKRVTEDGTVAVEIIYTYHDTP